MSSPEQIRNQAFNSQYATDKVTRIFTGTYQSSDLVARVGDISTIYIYPIEHGMGRPGKCKVITSTDSGVTWDLGVSKVAFCDSTYIYIFHGYVASGPVMYKAYYGWIDDYDDSNPSIESVMYNQNEVAFDSRENYQKIYTQGVLTFPTVGTFGTVNLQSIPLTFDYAPNVEVYFEMLPGEVWPLTIGGSRNPYLYSSSQDEGMCEIYSDRVDITINGFSNLTKRAWYKIYFDAT